MKNFKTNRKTFKCDKCKGRELQRFMYKFEEKHLCFSCFKKRKIEDEQEWIWRKILK